MIDIMNVLKWLLNLFIGLHPAGTISLEEASSVLLDVSEEAELYLPDRAIKIYRKTDVEKFLLKDETSGKTYEKEIHDCDDFAAELFGKGFGLVWTDIHALNWFIDESGTFYFVEPQSNIIDMTLKSWQGKTIRFFISR